MGKNAAKKIILCIYCLLLWSLMVPTAGYGDLDRLVGKITHVEGVVDILRGGRLPAIPVKTGDPVMEKDTLRTKSLARAEITFQDGNLLRIAQRSRINIHEYRSGEQKTSEIIKLTRGTVETVVGKPISQRISTAPGAHRFEIHTPNAVAGARGTILYGTVAGIVSHFWVTRGIAYVFNQAVPEKIIYLAAGSTTSISGFHPPLQPRNITKGEEERLKDETGPSEPSGPKKTSGTPPPGGESLSLASDSGSSPKPPVFNPPSFPDPPPSTTASSEPEPTPEPAPEPTPAPPEPEPPAPAPGPPPPAPVTYTLDTSSEYSSDWAASGNIFSGSFNRDGEWKLTLKGNGTPPATWTFYAGGKVTDDSGTKMGYWMEKMDGTTSGSDMSGTSSFDYLLYTRRGLCSGTLSGSISAGPPASFELNDTGSHTESSLTFTSNEADLAMEYYDGTNMVGDGQLTGFFGGSDTLWTASSGSPANIYMMGTYALGAGASTKDIWEGTIQSKDYNTGGSLTYDGGAFKGYMGGIQFNDTGDNTRTSLDGRLYTLYVDPSNNIGILKGSISGSETLDESIHMFKMSGSLYPVQMEAGSASITPSNFNSNVTLESYDGSTDTDHVPYSYRAIYLSGYQWGVWRLKAGGTAIAAPAQMSTDFHFDSGSGRFNFFAYIYNNSLSDSSWSGNKIYSRAYGYWADSISAPRGQTGIYVGETLGTYDAKNQTVTTGVWLDTRVFQDMVTSSPGTLQKLNIPAVEVGTFTLSGAGNNFTSLSMSNVKFYAQNAAAKPLLWATSNVSGTWTSAPVLNTAIPITGGGLSADFTFRKWTTLDRYHATIDSGSGTVNGYAVNFQGASSGTNMTGPPPGGNTILGAAAGVVK